ncbi:MAG: DUF2868 domain-containing protein [Pseudomonadota bacterium]
MNEQVARDVVLVRAIETADQKHEILSQDDRKYASRSAKELAQWQASDNKSEASAEHFLQHRAEQILKRLSERMPSLAGFLQRRNVFGRSLAFLPFLALLAGVALDRIADPHRVDLLSAPLLLIIGWNLLVYVGMIIWLCMPAAKRRPGGLVRLLSAGGKKLPRKLPHTLSAALIAFTTEWTQLSSKLAAASISRTVHLSAALFAFGAILSLYARGFLSQYAAGWESTFLDAGQVHGILSILFAPAIAVFQLQGFSIADIEALRFGQVTSPAGGARWVHLYAATLALLVAFPRMLLAAISHVKAKRLAKHFPLDLKHPYFRKLTAPLQNRQETLRVLPYSFTLDEARDKGLTVFARTLLGEQARVMLRPPAAYGEEPQDALRDTRLDDPNVTMTAVLFNLSATPEKENHGAFLDYLVRQSPRGLSVLIDESAYLERLGRQDGDQARIEERVALWQQFCSFHKAPATIVNLIDPGAGLNQSAAP